MFNRVIAILVVIAAALAAGAPASHGGISEIEKSRAAYRDAVVARQHGDYRVFLNHMRESARLRPDHPELLYLLANAFALTGDPDSALTCLEQIAEMGLTAPAREDSALISLQSDRRFKSVLDRFDVNTQPTMNCRIAFTLPQQDLVPEGLAYDPGSKSFFVSSVRERKIMRYQRGEITRFAGGLSDTLWSMMGMRLDAARGRLWVATSAIREGKGVPEKDLGGTGVLAFDIKTGVLSSRRILPADGAAHLFGDLTLDADGDVYVTDSSGGGLYRVPGVGGGPQLVIPPGTFASPQGLDMDESGRVLYVADYSQGVFRVDLETKIATLLRHPGRQTLLGIDGLYRYGNSLIAIQNGVRPQRVLRLGLNGSGEKIETIEILESSLPIFDDPTLGVIVGDALYFIANSHWPQFNAEGNLPPAERLTPPTVLRVAL
jgi:hypothetical protein